MSWEKIEDHLFNKYDVEGEDKELSELMEEHDKQVKAKAIDKFAERMKEKEEGLYVSDGGGFYNDSRERAYNDGISAMDDAIDEVVEQMKAGGENE